MFKPYNLFESVWQMNLLVALQFSRDLSTLNYMAVELSAGVEPEDLEELAEETSTLLERRHAA